MRQKLKNLSSIYIAVLMVVGLAFGLSGTASAASQHTEFACQDGSTGITITKDAANHQSAVTCNSGAKIVYIQYADLNIQPVAVDMTCPGNEQIGTKVDAPNQPTAQYIFYCVIINGVGDHATTTRTNNVPEGVQGEAKSVNCPDGSAAKDGDVNNCPVDVASDPAGASGACADLSKCDLITKYINPLINLLAALVGVAVVASIVIGGIQYGSSSGDPAKVTAAKNRIRNAIIALVTFLFLYALLNFLIPGGLF